MGVEGYYSVHSRLPRQNEREVDAPGSAYVSRVRGVCGLYVRKVSVGGGSDPVPEHYVMRGQQGPNSNLPTSRS